VYELYLKRFLNLFGLTIKGMAKFMIDILIGIILILLGVLLIVRIFSIETTFALVIILWGLKKAIFAGK